MPGARRADLFSLTGQFKDFKTIWRSSSIFEGAKPMRERRNFRVSVMSLAEGRGGLREMGKEWEER